MGCRTALLAGALFFGGSAAADLDNCSRELLLSYFPKAYVEKTLEENNIPKDQWPAIVSDLSKEDGKVVQLVEEKAAKMSPNPLHSSGNREVAVALFRETLQEIFTQVMSKHGVTDPEQIAAMLDDIQYQKAKRFIECMGESESKEKG